MLIELQCSLPYVRATILELHRRSHILPLVVRRVYKDAELKGYVIPKVTILSEQHGCSKTCIQGSFKHLEYAYAGNQRDL